MSGHSIPLPNRLDPVGVVAPHLEPRRQQTRLEAGLRGKNSHLGGRDSWTPTAIERGSPREAEGRLLTGLPEVFSQGRERRVFDNGPAQTLGPSVAHGSPRLGNSRVIRTQAAEKLFFCNLTLARGPSAPGAGRHQPARDNSLHSLSNLDDSGVTPFERAHVSRKCRIRAARHRGRKTPGPQEAAERPPGSRDLSPPQPIPPRRAAN